MIADSTTGALAGPRKIVASLALAALLGASGSATWAQPAMPILPSNMMDVPKDAPPPKAVPLGPYKVVVEGDPSLPTHTIYRPADLKPFAGGKLPIIAWGEGGCIPAGRAFEGFLTKIASHGYLVVAIGPEGAKMPNFAAMKPGDPPPKMGPVSRASELIDGINWAVAQNSKAGSRFAGKLNAGEIAVMGQSCGGLQAIAVSGDPRIKTSVIWNSGTFVNPVPMGDATKDSLKGFHAPVAYFIGGPTDVAYPNSEDDFNRIEGVPLFNGNLHVGHVGTYGQPNGGWFGEVGVAWLDWRLKGDKLAGKMFDGKRCGLCVNPAWTVKKKGMD